VINGTRSNLIPAVDAGYTLKASSYRGVYDASNALIYSTARQAQIKKEYGVPDEGEDADFTFFESDIKKPWCAESTDLFTDIAVITPGEEFWTGVKV
jgi:hypothetical protein